MLKKLAAMLILSTSLIFVGGEESYKLAQAGHHSTQHSCEEQAERHLFLEWQRDSRLDLTQAEHFTAPDADPAAKVVLLSDRTLPSFKVLGLEVANIDESGKVTYNVRTLYSKDRLQKNTPFVLTLTTFEYLPYTGISFEDSLGRVHRFAIEQSGMNGSVFLSEF